MFDIRQPVQHLEILPHNEDRVQPCHSLSCTPYSINESEDIILGASTQGVTAYIRMDDGNLSSYHEAHPNLGGKCISTRCDYKTGLCISSFRTTKEYSKPSYHVCILK